VLVFTRKRGEAIIIGDGIEVRVLRAGRDGVRLGIVHEQIRQANRAAANPAAAAGDRAAVEALLKARRR